MVHAAAQDDLSYLARLDADGSRQREHLRCIRNGSQWRHELGRQPNAITGYQIFLIEDRSAEPSEARVGYVVHLPGSYGRVNVVAADLDPEVSWLGPTGAVLDHARRLGDANVASATARGRASSVLLYLDDHHPLVACSRTRLVPAGPQTYGLYVRVPSLVAFLRAITPVLNHRLARSPGAGFTGSLRIDCFIDGVRIGFVDGLVDTVEPWRPPDGETGDVAMPRDALLHLMVGNHRLAELEAVIADCAPVNDRGALLADVLFPRMPLGRWWLA